MNIDQLLQQAAAGAAGAADTGDDDFANVVLLLDGDGTSGDENSTFTCENGSSGASVSTFTEVGNVVQGSFSPYGNNWSVYFDGSSYLNTANGATVLGTGAFTVEFWINTTDTSFNIMNPDNQTGNGFWGLMVQSGDLRWNNQYNLTNLWVVDGAPILDGQWHHVAIVSSSSVFKVFYDGVSQSLQSGSFNDSYNYPYNDGLRIGSGNLATFKGYLSNIRLVSGTAIYSSDFNVPTEPFTNSASYTEKLLACQSNRFIDNGDSEYDITISGSPKVTPFSPFKNDDARDIAVDGGSAYFDGDSYLHAPTNHGIRPENGGYTIEGWFYATKNTTQILFDARKDSNTNATPALWITSGDDLNFWHGYGTSTASNCFNLNEWVHVVANRDGSTTELFCNGVRVKNFNNTGTIYSFEQHFGARWDAGAKADECYLADWRIEEKVKIYTGSTITVPTAPVGVRTTTDSYMSFQEAGIYDLSGINNIDTVGNAQIDTAVKKYGTGSLEFDGTGDYLVLTDDSTLSMETGDFTVEFWSYCTGTGYRMILDNNWNSATNSWQIYINGEDTEILHANGASSSIGVGTAGNAVPNNQWTHLAFVKSGTTVKIYVNGTSTASGTMNVTFGRDSTNYIGIEAGSSYPFVGYIDDLRITKGVARYTSNFTPPTDALPKF